eukprot:Em0016g421a
MDLRWTVEGCFIPTVYQGVVVALPLLGSSLVLRLLVAWSSLSRETLNNIATLLGLYVLWWYYEASVAYFIALGVLVYIALLVSGRWKGIVVSAIAITFILACELLVVTAVKWHQVRGSFLVVVMKMVSLAFDLDNLQRGSVDSNKPVALHTPDFMEYASYCVFPGTTVFGPFITYSEHIKFLSPTPLSRSWLWHTARSLALALLSLGASVCVIPNLFTEPLWNKWLAAFSAAMSFRYSHYFVCYISQFSVLAGGLGHIIEKDGTISWGSFTVIHLFAVEIPRSLSSVVTNWNIPMHNFLKTYVFKPSKIHLGQFGAILSTYVASALLHGMNFQLAAVLLSIGLFAYAEGVLRFKLSKKLNACILDRPCGSRCGHHNTPNQLWVSLLNAGFSLLAVVHLAYLGLMFGVQSTDASAHQGEGFSMTHTLKKWSHLDFLCHWVALLTYCISCLL